jgi:hypothetical protein
MLDNLQSQLGAVRWIGGSASRHDEASIGTVSTAENNAKPAPYDAKWVKNPPEDWWTAALKRELTRNQPLLTALNKANMNDGANQQGDGQLETGQTVHGNGGDTITVADPMAMSHHAILWAGNADHMRHFNDIRNVRGALVNQWGDPASNPNVTIKVLFGNGMTASDGTMLPAGWNAMPATKANLQAALIALQSTLHANEQFLFYASDHGGLETDARPPPPGLLGPGMAYSSPIPLQLGELVGLLQERGNQPAVHVEYSGVLFPNTVLVSWNAAPLGFLPVGGGEVDLPLSESEVRYPLNVVEVLNGAANPLDLARVSLSLGGIDTNPRLPTNPVLALNEIYVSHAGTDTLEFIELVGVPGIPLTGFAVLVVEGDGPAAGTLDRAWDLSAATMPASGRFVLADNAVLPNDFPLGAQDALENGTNTFYVVHSADPGALVALVGTNVVVSGSATQIAALAEIYDSVALVDAGFPATDAVFDGAQVLGPDGAFLPAGILRGLDAPEPWCGRFLDFDPVANLNLPRTPGARNVACAPPATGTPFCFGDGSGTACPCGNAGAAGRGCANSVEPSGATLAAGGVASLSGDTLLLSGFGMPNGPCLYAQGTTQQNGGAGALFGDGLLCVGGSLVRLKTTLNVAGDSQYPAPGDPPVSVRGLVGAPGIRTYQVSYRDAAGFCTPFTFNLTNGVQVAWAP